MKLETFKIKLNQSHRRLCLQWHISIIIIIIFRFGCVEIGENDYFSCIRADYFSQIFRFKAV